MRRERCGSCGSNILQPFLDLGSTPLADAFPATADEHETFYPLGLCVCHHCWLVQNTEVVPDDLLYNADYGFFTGASPSSIAYFRDYAGWALQNFDPKFVVEIASNDGTLLRHFVDLGIRSLGVEPSESVVLAAKEGGVPTYHGAFGRSVAADIGKGTADLIIANNVVAHVSDLDDFLGGVADLLSPDGTAVVEFQNVADLLSYNQFDHVYHEHRSFFSLASFSRAGERHGLTVYEATPTPAQGGSWRVVVRRGTGRSRLAVTWLETPDAYTGFQGRIDHLVERLALLVWEANRSGPVAGYAASAKSTTLLNYCNLGTDDLTGIEDRTPYKIGRFSPGTKIPIVEKADADTYLLLAWNYLPGILERERAFTARGGKFIVPIPMPVLL